MPVGTSLYAPCDGTGEVGYDSGYGNYVVVVCPMPAEISEGESINVTMLYGHLSEVEIYNWQKVYRGDRIGYSGRSGNATAAGINPHVHFETILEGPVGDVDVFLEKLQRHCTSPTGLLANNGFSLGNNIDPFVVLSCFSNDKPALQRPWLQDAFVRWSADYAARTFDVNVGQR